MTMGNQPNQYPPQGMPSMSGMPPGVPSSIPPMPMPGQMPGQDMGSTAIPEVKWSGLKTGGSFKHPLGRFIGRMDSHSYDTQNKFGMRVVFHFSGVIVMEARAFFTGDTTEIQIKYSDSENSAWGKWVESAKLVGKATMAATLNEAIQELLNNWYEVYQITEEYGTDDKGQVMKGDVWRIARIVPVAQVQQIMAAKGASQPQQPMGQTLPPVPPVPPVPQMPQQQVQTPLAPVAPPAQISTDGQWKLINNQWVPNVSTAPAPVAPPVIPAPPPVPPVPPMPNPMVQPLPPQGFPQGAGAGVPPIPNPVSPIVPQGTAVNVALDPSDTAPVRAKKLANGRNNNEWLAAVLTDAVVKTEAGEPGFMNNKIYTGAFMNTLRQLGEVVLDSTTGKMTVVK